MKKIDRVQYASSTMVMSAFLVVSFGRAPMMIDVNDVQRWATDRRIGRPMGPNIGVPTPPPRSV